MAPAQRRTARDRAQPLVTGARMGDDSPATEDEPRRCPVCGGVLYMTRRLWFHPDGAVSCSEGCAREYDPEATP